MNDTVSLEKSWGDGEGVLNTQAMTSSAKIKNIPPFNWFAYSFVCRWFIKSQSVHNLSSENILDVSSLLFKQH